MADTDLAQTGKDVSISLIVDGRVIPLQDQVTGWKAKPSYTKIEVKPLGKSKTYIDQEPDGWEGSFDVDTSTPDVQDVIDEVNAALVAGTAKSINILAAEKWRNGSSRRYIYQDCKLEFDQDVKRGQSTRMPVTWKSGNQRIKR